MLFSKSTNDSAILLDFSVESLIKCSANRSAVFLPMLGKEDRASTAFSNVLDENFNLLQFTC